MLAIVLSAAALAVCSATKLSVEGYSQLWKLDVVSLFGGCAR